MRIPGADLRAQHAALRVPLEAAFQRLLDSAAFIGGAEVEAFEREFAAYCEVAHAVGVANGTDALALALRALDIGPGTAVALPAFTFAATAEAICHVGARPLFVDIDAQTFAMDPVALAAAIQASPLPVRAVIVVHLYGQVGDMDGIAAVARQTNTAVIEDAAQAHGARYHGRRAGGLGALAAFSFYPTKNLGALGDAGAVTTHDAELARRIAQLRDHGQGRKYAHDVVGFNARLDALQATVLRVKLPRLETWNTRRRALAARYRAALADLPDVVLPATTPECEPVYHLFVIRSDDRDALQAHLAAAGIGASVHYPIPLHLQRAFADLGHRAGEFPHAEAAAREVLALPVYPELSDADVDSVCAAVREWSVGRAASGRRLAR